MKKNRICYVALVLVLCVGMLVGCGNKKESTKENTNTKNEKEKYSVVCTIFPEYDWVKEILGDQAEDFDLTLLMDNGTDLHSFQPTAEDIAKISDCDVFIYVGGESDEWVEDALKEATNKDMQVINLLDILGNEIKEEEVVEGMESEEEESEEGEEGEEEIEYDEHVWLSVKKAKTLVSAIKDAICKVDGDNAKTYESNATAYIEKLSDLDTQFEDAIKKATKKTVLFGDRFPFRYMVDDYGLDYYAAFVGCSAETEASFETITFLANKVDELGLSKVLVLENSDQKIAETIIQNTKEKNQEIVVMDSMQGVTADDIANGATYLESMKKNLEVIHQAVE